MEETSDLIQIRKEKLEALKKEGIIPYPSRFETTHNSVQIKELVESLGNPPIEDIQSGKIKDEIATAGRIRMLREHGKLAFVSLQDVHGKVQLAFSQDYIGKDAFKFFLKHFDLGDYLGVKGFPFLTHKGEPTLLVKEYQILAKALRPLPEKFHGISDQEKIYRKRYLDLITNEESMKRFKMRSKFISALRTYLDEHEFIEVETPILQNEVSGAMALPFETHHNALDIPMVLRIAPETYLKRLVVGGFERVYEVAKCFRNEGIDPSHHQEFTMVEFYASYWNFEDNMNFTEQLLAHTIEKAIGTLKISYQGTEIDFTPPWPRVTFRELILKDTGIDIDKVSTLETLHKALKEHCPDFKYDKHLGYGNLLDVIYKEYSRPKLIQPQFVTRHPRDLKPLARYADDNPDFCESFQLLVNAWEVVNAYSELVDPIDQHDRFMEQARAKEGGDKEAHPYDKDYLEAMEYGMPPMSGWGMGVDRICTLLSDTENIRDTIFFPIMRPQNTSSKAANVEEPTDPGLSEQEAMAFVKKHANPDMVAHLIENQAAMKALARHFNQPEELWGIVGLLHDFDYTTGMDEMKHCGEETQQLMREAGFTEPVITAVCAHNPAQNLPRETLVAKAIYAVDELCGLIHACALVKPSKKLADVSVKSVKKKFKDKSFSRNVIREYIKTCETELDIPLEDFIKIALEGMMTVADEAGI